MIDNYYYLEKAVINNKNLDLSTLFDEDNGNNSHKIIVDIIYFLINKNKFSNNISQQVLRFFFIK